MGFLKASYNHCLLRVLIPDRYKAYPGLTPDTKLSLQLRVPFHLNSDSCARNHYLNNHPHLLVQAPQIAYAFARSYRIS
jgi:hypothetical protein